MPDGSSQGAWSSSSRRSGRIEKPITWAQAAVLRNKIKWMSIKYGDVMAKRSGIGATGRCRETRWTGGGPVQRTNIDVKKFSVEELKVFRELLNKATIGEES